MSSFINGSGKFILTWFNTGHLRWPCNSSHATHHFLKLWTVRVPQGLNEETRHRKTIRFVNCLREALVLGVVMHCMRLHGVPSAFDGVFTSRIVVVRPVEVQLFENEFWVSQGSASEKRLHSPSVERDVGWRSGIKDCSGSITRKVTIEQEWCEIVLLHAIASVEFDRTLHGHWR